MVKTAYLPLKKFNNVALELWSRDTKARVLRIQRLRKRVRITYQPKEANA